MGMGRNILWRQNSNQVRHVLLLLYILCSLFLVKAQEQTPANATAYSDSTEVAQGSAKNFIAASSYLEPLRILSTNTDADSSITDFSITFQKVNLLFKAVPADDPLVQHYLSAYSSKGGMEWISAIYKRSTPYAAYIRERIQYYQLPEELFFLPFIESEFNPMAVSRSGAMGLWQFMKNSIGGYAIHVNEWVDERRDFMKATDAALKKLKWNYEYFGDWLLALAAYNCGVGALDRAIKKAGTKDFWELKNRGMLSKETAHYIPKLLALITVATNARQFGYEPLWEPLPQWVSIPLAFSVDITILAETCGISTTLLRQGNAELKYNVTPPDASYTLKVPQEYAELIKKTLENARGKLIKVYLHKVSTGDTLSALSRHYEVSIDMIVRLNPGLKPDSIRIGQVLVIPALKDKKPYVNEKLAESPADFSGTYIVKKGDTLWQIALAYNVSPELLAEKNGLTLTSILREGMVLKVPIVNTVQS